MNTLSFYVCILPLMNTLRCNSIVSRVSSLAHSQERQIFEPPKYPWRNLKNKNKDNFKFYPKMERSLFEYIRMTMNTLCEGHERTL